MPNIPTGSYRHPGGILQIKDGSYGPIVRFIPTERTIPEAITDFRWYFDDEGFDGWEVEFMYGDGIDPVEHDLLPAVWRTEP